MLFGMTQMTVALAEDEARIVRERLASGLYANEAEVVRDALLRLEDEEAELAQALAELEAGEILDMTVLDVLAEIKAEG